MPIDNHVWILLLFNVTFILALSWLGFTFVKRGTHCFKDTYYRRNDEKYRLTKLSKRSYPNHSALIENGGGLFCGISDITGRGK